MQMIAVQQIKLTPVFVFICHFFTLLTYTMQSKWVGNSPPPSWLSFDSAMRWCSPPQRDESRSADVSRCLLFMGHFIILPNGVLTEQNANLVYENEVWWEWTSFLPPSQLSASFCQTSGPEQNRMWWGGGVGRGEGSDSAEGFQFVLTTTGLVISGHVDLCVVIERGIKHTWRHESRVYSWRRGTQGPLECYRISAG